MTHFVIYTKETKHKSINTLMVDNFFQVTYRFYKFNTSIDHLGNYYCPRKIIIYITDTYLKTDIHLETLFDQIAIKLF